MPQLSDLQKQSPSYSKQSSTSNQFDGEETLVVDARSRQSLASFVEAKLGRLVMNCSNGTNADRIW